MAKLNNLATKGDLSRAEKGLKKDIKELRTDHANLEGKVDTLTELVKELPTRDEMTQMLDRAFGFSVLKSEHELIKKILRDRLKVEI